MLSYVCSIHASVLQKSLGHLKGKSAFSFLKKGDGREITQLGRLNITILVFFHLHIRLAHFAQLVTHYEDKSKLHCRVKFISFQTTRCLQDVSLPWLSLDGKPGH